MERSGATCTRWLLVGFLLLGAALRLYGLNNLSPPGLEHDEVANWLIDRSILAGQHAVYFTEAYGHEAGFHYIQAAFVALLGDHALALRLPAAFLGLLGVAVTFALGQRLFQRRTALIAAALLAVLFWPVFYSRLGLRAISLPVLSGLSAYFWWQGWFVPRQSTRAFALSGLLAGLSLYTYMAARVVPIFYALFLLYLLLFHRQEIRNIWRRLFLFGLLFLVVSAPLVTFLLTTPGAEFRISEIDAPLQALKKGNVRPVVDNSVDILGMFGFEGDPLWRQNIAFWPVFDPLLATFFYACLLFFLVRIKDARYAFIFLWVFTAFVPSIVTTDAPSSIRIINLLPVLTLLPALFMHSLSKLSTETGNLSTRGVDNVIFVTIIAAILLFHFGRTTVAIFQIWPSHQEEVQFVWQKALTDAAAYLDTLPEGANVAVGGWSPDTMDPPTMALTLRRDDLNLRFFDPQQSLLVPAAPEEPSYVVRPTVLPFSALLNSSANELSTSTTVAGDFTHYTFTGNVVPNPQFPARTFFDDQLLFLGHTFADDCLPANERPCRLITYWQILSTPAEPLRFFLHAVDNLGQTVDNGDGNGSPAAYWKPGDLLLQQHELLLPAADFTLSLGVYHSETGQRLLTGLAVDAVLLAQPEAWNR